MPKAKSRISVFDRPISIQFLKSSTLASNLEIVQQGNSGTPQNPSSPESSVASSPLLFALFPTPGKNDGF